MPSPNSWVSDGPPTPRWVVSEETASVVPAELDVKLSDLELHGDNAYLNGSSPLASELQTLWQQAKLPFTQAATANVGKFWGEFGDRDTLSVRENYRAVSGVQGKFDLLGHKVDYDIFGQYGELDGYSLGFNVPNIQRVEQATDAVVLGGQIVCRSASARAAGCVPWDLLNGPSPAAVTWANANARANGVANQSIAAGNFSTSLLDLPAGPLGFAAGAEYRNESYVTTADPYGNGVTAASPNWPPIRLIRC